MPKNYKRRGRQCNGADAYGKTREERHQMELHAISQLEPTEKGRKWLRAFRRHAIQTLECIRQRPHKEPKVQYRQLARVREVQKACDDVEASWTD